MSKPFIKALGSLVILLVIGAFNSLPLRGSTVNLNNASSSSSAPLEWQSPAKLHRGIRSIKGTMVFNHDGIEFLSDGGRFSQRWPFIEIKTFDLRVRGLVLTTYQNNRWHRPGDRRYRFDLSDPVPPAVAARLAALVGKPVINGDPNSQGEDFATIPARHRTLTGGTNGTLGFSANGITYITVRGEGGRSWRWSDIQTLAHPDAYHFTVSGYRETFDFELKQPMSEALFDRLWSYVYGRNLRLGPAQSGLEH
ncbi:MAG: hypothetical protein ACRD06_03675 [Terriglobia bacterium]